MRFICQQTRANPPISSELAAVLTLPSAILVRCISGACLTQVRCRVVSACVVLTLYGMGFFGVLIIIAYLDQ